MEIFTTVLLLIYGSLIVYGQKTCEDCIQFSKCEGAMYVVSTQGRTPEIEQMFKKGFCGFDNETSGRKMAKVCCSDFPVVPKEVSVVSRPNTELLPTFCQKIDEQRVFSGPVTGIYEFPWMALISYRTPAGLKFLCGGSIINSRYILTAAHCVKDRKIAGVRVGENDIDSEEDCEESPTRVCASHKQDIYVDEILMHEGYKTSPVENDIALLRVRKPIDFSYKNVGPVCLPVATELASSLKDGERGVIAGWGINEDNTGFSKLLKIEVPVLNNSNCVQNEQSYLDKSGRLEFCVGENQKDLCGGDSGGPFVVARTYKNVTSYFQYGVLSRAPRACGLSYPAIYTNVVEYIGWITDNIRP